MAASFAVSYMRRERPAKCSTVWKVVSRADRNRRGRTESMLQLSTSISEQRTNRRLAVRLPLTVSGRDSRGVGFQEETSSENLCRGGAAFVTRFDLPVGCDVEIHIPIAQSSVRRKEAESDFATRGRVVHVGSAETRGERIIGVQFTGPHFRRMFLSESAA